MATPRSALHTLVVVGPDCKERRRLALAELFGPGTELVTAAGDLPSPLGYEAIVVSQLETAPSRQWLGELEDALFKGARLLVLLGGQLADDWAGWLGIRPGQSFPAGEWFLKPAFTAAGLTERFFSEVAIRDAPVEFEASDGEQVPVAFVNVAFKDRLVVAERRLGTGRVVTSGLGQLDEALSHRELARLFRRCVAEPVRAEAPAPVGLGVLGYGPYGGMGLYHGLAATATPGLEMIAACDFDPARRKAAEEEFPGLRPYASVDELASDEDVGLVVIATPPISHFELARRLLEAGKHVVLEKPMCLRVAEADELIARAASCERVLSVHQSRRWDSDFLLVQEIVRSGRLGELFNVETFVGGFEHPCRAWHSEVEVSGGAVYDWGSHHLDWILLLMGEFPVELTAHGHKRVWRDVTNLDQVRVRLKWEDGREAEFLQSDVAGVRRPKFYLQGTAGTLVGHYRPLRFEQLQPGYGYVEELSHHAEAPVELSLVGYESGLGLTETSLRPPPADRYGFHRNLADHLLLGEPLAVTPESARQVVALLEAAQRSTDEGNITVPLQLPGS